MTAGTTMERTRPTAAPKHRRESTASGLFGRGMVYVLVWSLQLVVSSLVSPVLAHLLPSTEFGYLATSIALYQLFSVLMVFGLDQALLMEHGDGGVRRAAAPRIVFLAAGIAALLTAALGLTGPAWSQAAGFPGFHGIVLLAVLWSGPGAVNLVLMALLRAQDRLGAFVAVNLLTSIGGQVGGVVVLLAGAHSAAAYGWVGVGVQYAALAVGLAVVRPRARNLLEPGWAGRVLGAGSALVAAAVAMFLLNTGDRVLLQRLDGADSVARYQIAYIVGSVPILLLMFLNQAWLPRILEIGDRARQWHVLAGSRDLLLQVVAPAVSALVVIAPVALRILAPASYGVDSLEPVVFWVAIAALPVADCAASTRALVALKHPGAVTVATGIAAVLNVLLNLVFIPVWHVTGAALATFVAFTAQALVARGMLGRHRRPLAAPGRRALIIVAGFAVLSALVALPLPTSTGWPAARVIAGLALLGYALVQLVRAESADL
jgi:O-antigen/teichoic acid export membrane protein